MKVRYKLHWNSRDWTPGSPPPDFKWVVYDWKFKCPVAYAETRVFGRKLCAFLNAEETSRALAEFGENTGAHPWT